MTKEVKKIYRSKRDKIIGGVCRGFAIYFNQDPTLIRLLFVLLLLVTAIVPGLIFYLIAWAIMPER